jgi:Bacteriocin (Lactococcin_972)
MNFKRIALTGLTAAAVLTGAAGIAAATIVNPPEGGTWDYGANASTVWSQYIHPSNCHTASTDGASGLRTSRAERGGTWATMTDSAALWGNEAYYNPFASGC